MKSLYPLVGFSKQAHWEWVKRQKRLLDKWLLLEPIVSEWRDNHPSMSLKKMYRQIKPDFIGVNAFINYCMINGYEAVSYKKAPRTTVLSEKADYPNLLADLKIWDINQVWVSDTTYFKILEKWFYLTFIMDLFSRRILGYFHADHLLADANLEALKMAFQLRNMYRFNHTLIHHSDRGTQYKSILYTNALKTAEIQISMGRIVYDNIHVERVHQTIKGEYLIHRNIKSERDLIYHLNKDVRFYNEQRPHLSLDMMTPLEFESYICNVPLSQRTYLEVFASKKNKRSKKILKNSPNPAQLLLPF